MERIAKRINQALGELARTIVDFRASASIAVAPQDCIAAIVCEEASGHTIEISTNIFLACVSDHVILLASRMEAPMGVSALLGRIAKGAIRGRAGGATLPVVGAGALLAAGSLLLFGMPGAPDHNPLTSEQVTFDFGAQPPSIVRHDFKFHNSSKSIIELVGIVKSCGCTQASADTTRLDPGSSGILHCSFNLQGRAGPYASSIDLVYREAGGFAAKSKSLVFAAYANVMPLVRLSENELTFQAGVSTIKELRVDIVNPNCRVNSVSTDQKCFSAAVAGGGKRIEVKFDSSRWRLDMGPAALWIMTDCAFENRIRVPLIVQGE